MDSRRAWLLLSLLGFLTPTILGLLNGTRPARAEDIPTATVATFPSLEKVWLSELPEKNAKVGYGPFTKNGAVFRRINSPHTLNMHPDATIDYQLGKEFRTFRATAAMADSSGPGSDRAIFFQVYGDGKLLWQSVGLHRQNDYQDCLVDISGVDLLMLKVIYDPQSKANGFLAHAVWLEPLVDPFAAPPELAALLPGNVAALRADQEQYQAKVRDLFRDKKYAELNALAEEARKKPDFLFGTPRLELFYNVIGPQDRSEASWLKLIDDLGAWRDDDPKVVTPVIALASGWIGYSWNARGYGSGNTVGEEGAKLHIERAQRALEVLKEAEKISTADPRLYRDLLYVSLALGIDQNEFERVLAAGMKADKRFYPLYDFVAENLAPRWGGESGAIEAAARKIRAKLGGELGDEVYARMAVHEFASMPYGMYPATNFRYPEVKKGIRAILHNYPEDIWLRERAVRLAIFGDDVETSRLILSTIGPTVWVSTVWRTYELQQSDRRWVDPELIRGEELKSFRHAMHKVRSVEFLPGPEKLIVAACDTDLTFWNPVTGKLAGLRRLKDPIRSLAVQPGGKIIAVGGGPEKQGDLLLFDVSRGGATRELKGHTDMVMHCEFSADGQRVATASYDMTARIWLLDQLDRPFVLKHPARLESCAFSPDGQSLATFTEAGELRLWKLDLEEPTDEVVLDKLPQHCVCLFSPDGKSLLNVGNHGIRVVDLKSREVKLDKRASGKLSCAAISPDGKLLAVGGLDIDIEIRDFASLKLLHTFKGHSGEIRSLAFSADGDKLVSGAADSTAKLWDVKAALGKTAAK